MKINTPSCDQYTETANMAGKLIGQFDDAQAAAEKNQYKIEIRKLCVSEFLVVDAYDRDILFLATLMKSKNFGDVRPFNIMGTAIAYDENDLPILIDRKGQRVAGTNIDIVGIGKWSLDGVIVTELYDEKTKTQSAQYLRHDGKIIAGKNARVKFLKPFLDGTGCAQIGNRWYFSDIDGQLKNDGLFNGGFEDASSFSEGLACTKEDNGEWHFINKDGQIVETGLEFTVGRSYKESYFTEGLLPFPEKNGEYCFYDHNFQKVLGPYKKTGHFENGTTIVFVDGLWQKIDKSGKTIKTYEFYKDEFTTPEFNEGYCLYWEQVEKDAKRRIVKLVDEVGVDFRQKFNLPPDTEIKGRFSSSGLLTIVIEGKKYKMDKKGRIIIEY